MLSSFIGTSLFVIFFYKGQLFLAFKKKKKENQQLNAVLAFGLVCHATNMKCLRDRDVYGLPEARD